MVETVIAMVFLLAVFFLLVQLTDNLRTKLVFQYAAARCARAATIGLNPFMIRKTAHVATIPASGAYLPKEDDEPLGNYGIVAACGPYLESSTYEAAKHILDFEYWQPDCYAIHGDCRISGGRVETRVYQNRPQFFSFSDFAAMLGNSASDSATATIEANAKIEAHADQWLTGSRDAFGF